jgi:two-component system response regulator (stage 0 sporulation protein F)
MILLARHREIEPASRVILLGDQDGEDAERKASALGAAYVYRDPHSEKFLREVRQVARALLASPPALPTAPEKARGRLLIVDDEPHIREILETYFKGRGIEVLSASSGPEALAIVKKERPHLMLLDLRMPGMSGLDVLKSVRALDQGVEVIMITANGELELARETLREGACDYVMKPFDLRYLETSVLAKLLTAVN